MADTLPNIDHLGEYIRFAYLREQFDRYRARKKPSRVLACGIASGCSAGADIAHLAQKYPRATFVGTDIDEGKVLQARKNISLPNVRFHQQDLTRLGYGDGVFDFFYALDVLEHIPDDHAAVREVRRVLRPDGEIFVHVPYDRGIPCEGHVRTGYFPDGLATLLKDEGFRNVHAQRTFMAGRELDVYRKWNDLRRKMPLNDGMMHSMKTTIDTFVHDGHGRDYGARESTGACATGMR